MEVQIKVVSIENNATIAKNGGGSYKGTRIAYRDAEGQLKEKNIHSNVFKFNPSLKNQLEAISNGDDAVMELLKEGEYWNLKSIKKGAPPAAEAASGNGGARAGNSSNVSPKSTYETAEERAKKQVYIVRQSSITQALTYLSSAGISDPFGVDDVLKIASRFEAHVFGNEFDDGSLAHLPPDDLEIQ